jgi:hypothetical protein
MDEKQRVSGDATKEALDARVEKALDAVEQYEENPELDRKLNRKFDLHILPWLFGIWVCRASPDSLI